jgi:CheY-like chemotaxis protein
MSAVSKIAPKSILVVEDEPLVSDTMRLLLTTDGHSVEVVDDGETAWARYAEGKYDLVMTDYSMPGIDGLDLAGLIKARAPKQRVVLVTAYQEAVSNSERERLHYIDGMLGKPFGPEQLRETLKTVFPQG